MGVFGWQLVRFSSPKYSLRPPVFPKDAGESFFSNLKTDFQGLIIDSSQNCGVCISRRRPTCHP